MSGTNCKCMILLIAFLGSFVFTCLGQGFPYDDFKARTLKALAAMDKDVEQMHASQKDGKPTVVMHADMLMTRARVVYMGSTRPISEGKKENMKTWAGMFTASKETYIKAYESDVLFTEGGVEYWLPVQKQVIPYFDKELKKGDEVDLFIIRAGGIYDKDKWDWIWLTEEFMKPKS